MKMENCINEEGLYAFCKVNNFKIISNNDTFYEILSSNDYVPLVIIQALSEYIGIEMNQIIVVAANNKHISFVIPKEDNHALINELYHASLNDDEVGYPDGY